MRVRPARYREVVLTSWDAARVLQTKTETYAEVPVRTKAKDLIARTFLNKHRTSLFSLRILSRISRKWAIEIQAPLISRPSFSSGTTISELEALSQAQYVRETRERLEQ